MIKPRTANAIRVQAQTTRGSQRSRKTNQRMGFGVSNLRRQARRKRGPPNRQRSENPTLPASPEVVFSCQARGAKRQERSRKPHPSKCCSARQDQKFPGGSAAASEKRYAGLARLKN